VLGHFEFRVGSGIGSFSVRLFWVLSRIKNQDGSGEFLESGRVLSPLSTALGSSTLLCCMREKNAKKDKKNDKEKEKYASD
jgi:hypothetical protein